MNHLVKAIGWMGIGIFLGAALIYNVAEDEQKRAAANHWMVIDGRLFRLTETVTP